MADLIDIMVERQSRDLVVNRLQAHFTTTLRTSHLFGLLHQSLEVLCMQKCGSLVTPGLLAKLTARTLVSLVSLCPGGCWSPGAYHIFRIISRTLNTENSPYSDDQMKGDK